MAQRTRAQRLNGLFPLSYMGVVPVSPVNFVIDNRPPTINDSKNFYIGDLWLDDSSMPVAPTVENLWILVSLSRNDATWVNFAGGGIAAESFPTDSGTAVPVANALNIIAGNSLLNSGSTVKFTGSGNTVLLNVTDLVNTNTLIGGTAGNLTLTGTANTGLGSNTLHALTTGVQNTAIGVASGQLMTTGSHNVLAGVASGSSMTSGSENVGVGRGALVSLLTGVSNLALGDLSGGSYVGAESSNILINNTGVAAESNTIRIGTQGGGVAQQNRAFIAGVAGVSVSNQLDVVIDSVTGQLGTVAGGLGTVTGLLAQDGNTVTPTAGVIQVSGAGNLSTTGTVGPNTLTVNYLPTSSFTATWNTETNITGDGSTPALGATAAATVITNVGGDFFPGNGAGIGASYTVPVTGLYYFFMFIDFTVGASATAGIDFSCGFSGGVGFNLFKGPTSNACAGFANNSGDINIGGSCIMQVAATTVINFTIQSNGTGKNLSVNTGTVGGYRIA